MEPAEGTLSPAAVVDEIVVEARALEEEPGFPHSVVDTVRAATAWLSAEPTPGDVRQAAQLLSHQAGVAVEPQLTSPGLVRRLVKLVVHRLIGWYVRVLAQQVAALGEATARLGLAVAERTERLQSEATTDREALSARLDSLSDRLSRLEAQVGEASGTGPGSGSGSGPASGGR